MSQVKLIGIAPCYNELEAGNLERFLQFIPHVVDGLVLLDDASTDGSYERMLEATPHVMRNRQNRFLWEQDNTQTLINRALEVYPDLTHILTLNIDATFSPACYKEGEALIHKACHELSSKYDMLRMRDIQLWRSQHWHRVDNWYGSRAAERVYIREKGLKMLRPGKGLHKGKFTSTHAASITTFKEYAQALSIHWGWDNKDKVVRKFHRYIGLEPAPVPDPKDLKERNVYKLLDEFNLSLAKVEESWFDPACPRSADKRKPRPVSYFSELMKYDTKQALAYRAYFTEKLGYHSEEELYIT